jgi:hypothetical protein
MTLTDVKTLRARARWHIEGSAVEAGHAADRALVQMIREDLVAERIAIDSYLGALRYLGDQGQGTSEMLRAILAVDERHADELADLLTVQPGRTTWPAAPGRGPRGYTPDDKKNPPRHLPRRARSEPSGGLRRPGGGRSWQPAGMGPGSEWENT